MSWLWREYEIFQGSNEGSVRQRYRISQSVKGFTKMNHTNRCLRKAGLTMATMMPLHAEFTLSDSTKSNLRLGMTAVAK